MTDILMPALSPTMEEGTLAKWNVKAGDTVSAGDVIAEIETDKATMEVEAVDEGVVAEILVPAGTEGVKVNTPIAKLKGEGGEEASKVDRAPTLGPFSADARAPREEKANEEAERAPEPPQSLRDSSPKGGASDSSTPPAKSSSSAGGGGARIFASPLARRLAEKKGVDLAAVKGTGPRGRIVAADVEGARPGAAGPAAGAAPAARAPEAAPVKSLAQLGIPDGSYDLAPLDGMRRTIARRMTESFRDIPHFPLTMDLQIDRLLDARGRINASLMAQGVKVSVNDLLIKAAAAALKKTPDANASYTPEGIALHHHADVAVAVAIDGGLITPIIRKAETKTLAEISVEMKDLAERARSRKLKPEEFQGGTFSLSNLGMFGIKSFASIINEPQGAILSVGAGEKRAIVKGDQIVVANMMTVTLTCDHRVVDGAIGSRWLQAFKGFVEDPITLLA